MKRPHADQPAAVLEKMKHWCAWQERCQSEVRRKLRTQGLTGDTAEFIIAVLISEGYLNEERFARAYARGKFRMKQWGRIRIRQELKKLSIPETLIAAGMSEIAEGEYRSTLHRILALKAGTGSDLKALHSAARYAMSKGYEPKLVFAELKMEQEEFEE